ncbi:DUF2878 domain-containing protein [Marinimicrobium agarilyticum]|uniref:DUF2878 domain-containing protein n=1 Tax=Marinimicrobium agarilyticum TaxID=306546 RepID=UPI0003F4D58A|nr:DUF2878 domain-containing protein [Marinimicrobium agarilyticum]
MNWRKHYWLINAVASQVGWFVCVMAGNVPGIVFTFLFVVLHFRFAPVHPRDWLSICVALPMGVAHDNLLGYLGVLDFGAISQSGLAPAWLTCLWVIMALTLHHPLKLVYERPWLIAALGAIGGPMAYLGGIQLSGAEWGVPVVQGFLIMMAIWCWLLPLHRWLVLKGERVCSAEPSV